MGHTHSHGHGRLGRMGLALGLLVAFLGVEVAVGLLTGSLALLADAGHMLTDVLAMGMGLAAVALSRRTAAGHRTFGWHRAEVLTAVVNAVLLLGVAAFIAVEAVERLGSPVAVPAAPMIVTAVLGLAVNVVVMLLLRGDAEHSIAVKGAYLEVLADAVGSVGVLVAGVVTLTTRWPWADVVVAVLLALWVVPRAVGLALSALRILVQRSPGHVDVAALEREIAAVDGVLGVHDLHVWTLTTGMDVVTVHVTSAESADVLGAVRDLLARRGLPHATIQVETRSDGERCASELTF